MSSELEKLIEREIEARARVLAEQMFAAAKKSEVPSEIAPNGEFITPFLFGGKKYLSRQQVESLVCVKYPALWKWKRDGKLSYHKAGGRLLFSYDDVHQLVNGAAAI